jgi:hypothetical protein
MPLQLRDNLSFCICDGRPIFLDLDADRYFCLGPAVESSFKRWAAGPARDEGDEEFSLLRVRGLLVPGPRTPSATHAAILPQAARDLDADHPPRLRDVVQALTTELAAGVWLRSQPLTKILGRRVTSIRRGALTPEQADIRAAQIAVAFGRSALILGSADRCLARALAAKSLCRRRGLSAALIFGVRINPFGAHSWVQLGDAVLVGEFEQARLFTPILSVQ